MVTLPNKPDKRDFSVKIVKDGLSYTLPLTNMSKDASDTALKLENKAYNHGSIITGFNKVPGRNIELSTYIEAGNEAGYLAAMRELKRHVHMSDYRLYIAENRYFNIKGISKFSAKDYDGFVYRRADIDITLLAADPFEYTGLSRETIIEATDGLVFELDNDCNIDVPLIVTVTPVISAPEITLSNETYNRKFTHKESGLTNPAVLTVNTETGTVTVDCENHINNFSGAFLSLAAGRNIFTYTGADARLEFIYKERYI